MQLHQRVDDRLRVHRRRRSASARDAEQPVRLDHLEALVHQRRRVDRDLAAHLPRRMAQRVLRRDALRARRRRAARNGPPEAVSTRRRTSRRVAAVQALVDRVVLAVDRQHRPRRWRRAASITSSPAITSTSLLASAMVLPASIAASTASSAAVPDEAHSTMSDIGLRRDGDEPLGAGTACTAGRRAADGGAQRVDRGRSASAADRGR